MSTNPASYEFNSFADVSFADLEKSLLRPRTLTSGLLSGIVAIITIIELIPLILGSVDADMAGRP